MRRVYTERSRSGFTLIEMMVVVTVLALIAGIGSSMLYSILRGSTKTQTMLMVKQQGEFATSVMGRMIRNARSIVHTGTEPTYTSNSLKIYSPDGMPTEFFCGDNIASGAAALTGTEVIVSDCLFTITRGQAGINPDTVRIKFKLKQVGTSTRPEEQSSLIFDTTISLRNY